MVEKTCRCGKTKKNFNVDIGPFFIAECCTEAGYDHLGNRPEINPEDLGLKTDEVKTALAAADQLQVVDEPGLDGDDPEETEEVTAEAPKDEAKEEPQEESKSDKKKRPYNRNGQIKK